MSDLRKCEKALGELEQFFREFTMGKFQFDGIALIHLIHNCFFEQEAISRAKMRLAWEAARQETKNECLLREPYRHTFRTLEDWLATQEDK